MKRFLLFLIPVLLVNVLFLPELVKAQTKKPSSDQPIATQFRIEAADPKDWREIGKLYITVGGRERKIADKAIEAWIINGGKEVVYSGLDGAGGVENEGQSLRIYDVGTKNTRKILSESFVISALMETKLSTGEIVLLVRLGSMLGSSAGLVVIDPKRGKVLESDAGLTKIEGDFITLSFYRVEDWGAIDEWDLSEETESVPDPYPNGGVILKTKIAKPYKTLRYDLKKIIKKKVISNKPNNK
jgi:hypothetical protein